MSIKWGCEGKHKTAETDYSQFIAITPSGDDRRGEGNYNRGFCKICSAQVEHVPEKKTQEDEKRLKDPAGLFKPVHQFTSVLFRPMWSTKNLITKKGS